MIRPSPISTRTATLFPYTTLFRSPDGIRKSIVKVQNRTARGRFRRARADRDNAAPVFAFHIGRDGTYEMGETLHNVGVSAVQIRSEEHTSELQSLMRISYAVFCLKKQTNVKRIVITIKNPLKHIL